MVHVRLGISGISHLTFSLSSFTNLETRLDSSTGKASPFLEIVRKISCCWNVEDHMQIYQES